MHGNLNIKLVNRITKNTLHLYFFKVKVNYFYDIFREISFLLNTYSLIWQPILLKQK